MECWEAKTNNKFCDWSKCGLCAGTVSLGDLVDVWSLKTAIEGQA